MSALIMTAWVALLVGLPGQAIDRGETLERPWDSVESVRVVVAGSGDGADGIPRELRAELRIAKDGYLYLDWAHGNDATWSHDPYRVVLSIHEDVVTQEIPYRRVVVKYPVASLGRKAEELSSQAIWAVLGWWPEGLPVPCPRVHDVPTDVKHVVDDAGYRVLSEGDVLVARSEVEEIGFSLGHGLAIQYRIWRDEEHGHVLSSMYVDSFRQLAPEVWFPQEFRVLRHNPEDETETRLVQYRVLDARVNDLGAEDFDLVLPPGTYLVDADGGGGGQQIVPGGFDLMEAQVDLIRSNRARSGWPGRSNILGALGGVATYLVYALLRRKAP